MWARCGFQGVRSGGLGLVVFCVAVHRCRVWFRRGDMNFIVGDPIRLSDGDFKMCLHIVGVYSCECFLVCDQIMSKSYFVSQAKSVCG